tara:strand:+ start:1232 stop:1852 length:621 start_codon:yes stop_codon:yes gene_type:complete
MEITLVKDAKRIKHQIPTNWNEVSLKQYVAVIKKSKEVGLRELEKMVHIIEILTGIKEKDMLRLPTNNVTQLGVLVSELLSSLPEDELKHIIKLNDVEYGFHPKLSEITMGEWVDIDNYISNGFEDNLHKIMAILYRPIILKKGNKYQIEPYEPNEERQKLFLDNLMVGDFYGVSVFFSDLGRELLTISLKSSIQNLKSQIKENQE